MKPKIIIDRDPIGSQEILSRKNFSQLVTDAKLMQKPFFKSAWFISSVVVTLSAAALVLYFSNTAPGTEQGNLTGASVTGGQPETTFRYAEDSPCIKPPVPGTEKKFSSVMIDPSQDALIHSPNGTDIIIPARSIVDLNNNPVTGTVEIRFRELHDVPEIMLSGIPMEYDSAGADYSFSSAGMIQIYGYQDNKPVKMEDGKELKIVLASRNGGKEYNFYTLDTTSGKWSYTGKEAIGAIASAPSLLPAVALTDSVQIVRQESKHDTTLLRIEKEIKILKGEIAKIRNTQPEAPRKIDPDKYNFDIAADPKEFPELARLAPVRFEVGAENKNFTSENYDIIWDNVELLENEKGKNYKIRLIKGRDSREYIVYPVYEGASYEEAKKKFDADFKSYNDQLKKKEKEEAEKKKELELINKKRNEEIRRNNEMLRAQQQKSIHQSNANAGKMNEWRLRQYGLSAQNGVVYNLNDASLVSNTSVVTRTFNAAGFGTYNSDHPRIFPPRAKGQIAFYDHESRLKVDPQEVFAVVKDDNMYFRYFRPAFSTIGFHPKKTTYLVAVLPDGRVGIAKSEQIAAIDHRATEIRLELELSKETVKDEKYFRSLMENI